MSFGNSTSTQPVDMVTAEFLSAIFPDGGTFTTDQHFKYKPFTKLDSDEPQYYAICAVKDGADGTKSRKNENFKSLNVLVCDDVGTKAAIPPLPPSYIIETSLGNFQYGYILDKPETDFVKANRLVTNLVKSGYSDPGASGIVRLVRLPAGINIKPQHNGFKVERTEWHPDRRYTYKELLNMLSPNVIHLSKNSEPYEVPEEIIEGNRNTQMTQLFGHYHSELGAEGAIIKICSYNKEHCKPPLDDKELKAVIDSISRREAEKEEKLESAKKDLLENIVHILDSNMYYSFTSHIDMYKEALNTQNAEHFPGGKGNIPRASAFLEMHPNFQKADTHGFRPSPYGQESFPTNRIFTVGNKRMANRWPGFAVVPQEGDVQPWLDHLAHIIPEEDYRQHFLSWLAFMVQKPHIKCQWQVVILGIEGAGKDLLLSPISQMFGSAASLIGNKDVSGDYDDGWANKKFVTIGEARGVKDDAMEKLKLKCTSTSNDYILLNPKKEAKVTMENLWSIAIITNNPDALRCSNTERRFFVVKSCNVMTEDKVSTFLKWRDSGDGAAHLMRYLLDYDLSSFNHGKLPCLTTHFYDMLDMTRTLSEDDVKLKIETKAGLFSYDFINSNNLRNELIDSGKAINKAELQATLDSNGYVKFPKKINKNVNGKTESKTAAYYVKKDSKWLHSEVSAVWDEIDRIEKLLEAASNQAEHSYKY